MGHVPTAPALRCPADPRHVAFTGSQRACFGSSVTLDANGTVVRRVTGPLLYDVSNPRDHAIVCAVCGARAWRPWVPIPFMPADGMMLLCDFSTGFRPPEMVKMRPVVVLSHRARNAQTCVVVPTSTVPPKRASAICILLDPSRHPFLDRTSYAEVRDDHERVAPAAVLVSSSHDGTRYRQPRDAGGSSGTSRDPARRRRGGRLGAIDIVMFTRYNARVAP